MKLKECRKFWEDIYNDKIKLGNNLTSRIKKISDPILESGNENIEEKVIYEGKTGKVLVNFTKIKGEIYLMPLYFVSHYQSTITYTIELLEKHNFSIREKLEKIIDFYFSNLTMTGDFRILYEYIDLSEYPDIVQDLFKQQILINEIIKDFYYNDLIEVVGKKNIKKFLEENISKNEMSNILKKWNPNKYLKIDSLLTYIKDFLEKNNDIDVNEKVSNSLYYLNFNSLKYPGKVNLEFSYIKFRNKIFMSRRFNIYFDDLSGFKNDEYFIKSNNKKEFVKILEENNFFDVIFKMTFCDQGVRISEIKRISEKTSTQNNNLRHRHSCSKLQ